MSLPGFTAEASAYSTKARHLPKARATGSTGSRVVPSKGPPPGPICGDCIWDTYDFPSGDVCAKLCMDRGDPEIYPELCDPGQCPVKCTRCLGYINGRYQYCMGGGYGAGEWVSCEVQKVW